MEKMKAIFHIDEMDKWELVIKNIKNLVNASSDSDVVLLANSVAVKGLTREADHEADIELLIGEDVKLRVCKNAMKELKLGEDDLIRSVEIVPAGVVELIERQNEGYKYIKP